MNTLNVSPGPVPVLMVKVEQFLLEVVDLTFDTYSGGVVPFVLLMTRLAVLVVVRDVDRAAAGRPWPGEA